MWLLRSAILFLVITYSSPGRLDTRYGYGLPGAYHNYCRGNNDDDVSGLVYTDLGSDTPVDTLLDPVFEPQPGASSEDTSAECQHVVCELPSERVVLEEHVVLRPGTRVITLDIVLHFDLFVEFHESELISDSVSLALTTEFTGHNSSPPDFILNYQVISLGPKSEILVHLSHADTAAVTEHSFITVGSTIALLLAIILALAGRQYPATALTWKQRILHETADHNRETTDHNREAADHNRKSAVMFSKYFSSVHEITIEQRPLAFAYQIPTSFAVTSNNVDVSQLPVLYRTLQSTAVLTDCL